MLVGVNAFVGGVPWFMFPKTEFFLCKLEKFALDVLLLKLMDWNEVVDPLLLYEERETWEGVLLVNEDGSQNSISTFFLLLLSVGVPLVNGEIESGASFNSWCSLGIGIPFIDIDLGVGACSIFCGSCADSVGVLTPPCGFGRINTFLYLEPTLLLLVLLLLLLLKFELLFMLLPTELFILAGEFNDEVLFMYKAFWA